jgi:hypothetical protein
MDERQHVMSVRAPSKPTRASCSPTNAPARWTRARRRSPRAAARVTTERRIATLLVTHDAQAAAYADRVFNDPWRTVRANTWLAISARRAIPGVAGVLQRPRVDSTNDLRIRSCRIAGAFGLAAVLRVRSRELA